MACVIAAPASGSGKTLLSLCLIAWARQLGHSIQPFKVGPDYLDPQLLSLAATLPCRNLDLPLCGDNWVQLSFNGYGGRSDMTLVEGVMGLFDGIGASSEGSTAEVAVNLDIPVVLVVDAGGQARSLGALVRGFRDLDPRLNLAGVVLNRVSSPRHRELLEEVLTDIGVQCLGCLPKDPSLELPNRHLGLAPAHELSCLQKRLGHWASLAKQHLNMDVFRTLLQSPKRGPDPIQSLFSPAPESSQQHVLPIAVAQDEAFHFRYPEMQECLELLGMPVLPWSPLSDAAPPSEATGLILPGGFPELHAEQLSECKTTFSSLHAWLRDKPIYAECGGMLLLGRGLAGPDGTLHTMAGLLPFEARLGRLQVGYRLLEARTDSLLLRKGERLRGHEFHRWQLCSESDESVGSFGPLWQVEGWKVECRAEGWNLPNLHASWVHLHWAGSSMIPCRWRAALGFAAKRNVAAL
ncbi:Cobyrinic acid A,C-diamide synthase [Synechococcus sp. MIT S9509]|uniref:cobyrinate a,c-diamide synthase n=1 Tax=unclassified Synechococcus TaxID=2626047 RepID=UPI0007BB84D7|nr:MULTISPECIES: cobyrinate a,c-diamide synthase [unclassified Synechococcus]KZR85189.1 Cobyrinic acid A,C-diamide synthase [Synechococcus sp. MIT S9504]KZR91278.1 Cobyrinic acid A,C-diamide synthase [Synechococcus sp. MIT S9509]